MYVTPVHIEPISAITYSDNIFLMGSCFSTYMGNKMERLKFLVLQNPFGVLYNPASIAITLERMVTKKYFSENDFFLDEDIYKSYYLHSSLAGTSISLLLKDVNHKIEEGYEFAQKSTWFFITLGSATVYRLKKTDEIIANCQKQPTSLFREALLTVEQCLAYLEKIKKCIYHLHPKSKIVFTVSPVRYFKQGAHANQISKSILFVALHQLMENNPEIIYYPAYEIFNDELRDYRYYAADMIHPGEVGIEHIWKNFSETFFEKETLQIMHKVEEVQKALEHRTFFPESKSYHQFIIQLQKKITQLEKEYPFLKFNSD